MDPVEKMMPSGAVLKIMPAPFEQARGLFQAVLKEIRAVEIISDKLVMDLYKNLLTSSFSSKEVEKWLWACMVRCTYNLDGKGDLKIDASTFEPERARGDYVTVCMEVARVNIDPFAKSLWSEFLNLLPEATSNSLKPKQETTSS
jgi:hypothetical protein